MSVAFRRESDEEHLEPRFELPIPPGPNLVTKRGYELIKNRNAELDVQLAGELDEERRKALLRDLRYWRNRLATAQIAPISSGETVTIGTRVEIESNGKTRVLSIVGHDESDPASNRIALGSPLAKAMIGAEVGDEIELPGSHGVSTLKRIDVD